MTVCGVKDKFTLNYNLKNTFKNIYRYLTIENIISGIPKICWKCKQSEGIFCHLWWTCKTKNY